MIGFGRAFALLAVLASAGLFALRFVDFDHVLLLGLVGIAPAFLAFTVLLLAALLGRREFAIAGCGVLVAVLFALPGTVLPRLTCDVTEGEPKDIVVFSHNTLAGNTDIDALSQQVESASPDLVVLQETTSAEFAAIQEVLGDRYPHFESQGYQHILSAVPLSDRFVTGTSTGGALVASADFDGIELRVANVHPSAPVTASRRTNQRSEFEALSVWSEAEGVDVLIGDFNASSAHRILPRSIGERYVDAHRARGCGTGLTWSPVGSRVLPLLSLDHAFVDATAFEVVSFEVFDYAGSDHKAIAVRLRSAS